MGSMCSKSEHFDGDGNRLDSSPSSITNTQPKPKPLPNSQTQQEDTRQAAAAAAEARAKAAALRGTKPGGEISKALAQQPADGGRVDEAIAAGSSRSQNHTKKLVWD